jgi:16S rRNA (guanine527-N7)-methyltransferase
MERLLSDYFLLLQRWNTKVRLVSDATDAARFEREHVEDVRRLLPFLSGVRTLLDIGTGAGIPGIIIKILLPEIHVSLLDATRKKINFCEEAIRRLGLGGIRAVCGRAEDPEIAKALGTFDAIVSRATWELDKYIGISSSYMDIAGKPIVMAMKGPGWKEELQGARTAMEREGLRLVESHQYCLSDGRQRSILIFGAR